MSCFAAQNGRLRAINRKILSGFHRSSYWLDFNETSRVIITIPICAYRQHVLLCCTKWLPELNKVKSCPAIRGQNAGVISTKIHWSDQNHTLFWET
jgi:hypothetical protein